MKSSTSTNSKRNAFWRNLFIKLVPSSGYTIATAIVDLTSSGIRNIKTLITPSTTSLATMSLSGTLQAIIIKNLVTAPANAKVQFKLKDTWVDSDQLASYASTNAATITAANLLAAKAQYAVRDTTLYVLSNNYETTISTDIKIPYTPTTPFTTNLSNIKANLTTSSQTSVAWNGLQTLTSSKPAQITEIKFYSGTLATLAEVSAALESVWASALPTSVTDDRLTRHLFARLTPATGYSVTTPIIDLTTSSDIQSIKTYITTQPLAMNTISYKVIDGVTTVDTKRLAFPANTIRQYEFIGDGVWRNQQDFITYVNGLTVSVAATAYQNVKARLAPESSFYALDNDRVALILFDNSSNYRTRLIDSFSNVSFFPSTAISTNVFGVRVQGLIQSDKIVSGDYRYLYGEYTTLESVKSAPETAWTLIRPWEVSYDKSKRNIWMRINVKSPAELGSQTAIRSYDLESFGGDKKYIELTTISGVRNIRSDVAQGPLFASYSLNGVKIGGSVDDPYLIYSGLTPLPGTKFVFKVNGYTYGENDLTYAITSIGSDTTRPDIIRSFLGGITIELALDDATNYALSSTKQASVYALQLVPPIRNVAEWNKAFPQYAGKIVNNKVDDRAFENVILPAGFVLPEDVTEIGKYSFSSAKLPAWFRLPNSVSLLNDYAFQSVALTAGFTIPAAMKLTRDATPFYGALFASDFVIPSAMINIPDNLFSRSGFSNGFIIPSTVKTIGDAAFRRANIPVGVTIPDSVTDIGSFAFDSATVPPTFSISKSTRYQANSFLGTKLPGTYGNYALVIR